MAPDAQPDDGVIHLVVMRECSRVTGLRTFLLSETCDHLDMPHVGVGQCFFLLFFLFFFLVCDLIHTLTPPFSLQTFATHRAVRSPLPPLPLTPYWCHTVR